MSLMHFSSSVTAARAVLAMSQSVLREALIADLSSVFEKPVTLAWEPESESVDGETNTYFWYKIIDADSGLAVMAYDRIELDWNTEVDDDDCRMIAGWLGLDYTEGEPVSEVMQMRLRRALALMEAYGETLDSQHEAQVKITPSNLRREPEEDLGDTLEREARDRVMRSVSELTRLRQVSA